MRVYRAVALCAAALILCSAGVSAGEDPRSRAGRFASVDEMLEYRALPKYNEAPSLAALVAQGLLPPVEERLPEEPIVWKRSVMVDGIGVYGDVLRRSRGTEPSGWANLMGIHSAWDGAEGFKNEGLLEPPLAWMLESPDPVPNLARSWEWSKDGLSLTMHLMRGVKWSDGVEFTAEDVLFSYYDIILDENVPSYQGVADWTFGGKVTELEKIDDYTIVWKFGAPFPVRVFTLLDSKYNAPIAAHVYKHYHPRYNPSMTYEDLLRSADVNNLPAVSLGAFVPVHYVPAEMTVYVRNPYYFKVDEQGNQLPYLDAVIWIEDPDWSMRNFRILTGEVDVAPLQDAQLTRIIYAASREPSASFVFQWGPFTQSYALFLNYSLELGVRDERDLALRNLFRDIRFRQAISHALDRDAIAEGVFGGPDVRAHYGAYPTGSPFHRAESVVSYPYAPACARELLTELGFADTNRDGLLEWPSNSLIPGETLTIELMVPSTAPDLVATAEAVAPYLRAVGIDLRVRVLGGVVYHERQALQEFDIDLGPTQRAVPDTNPGMVGPISPTTPYWHKAGPNGHRSLLDFEARIGELLSSTFTMRDTADRVAAFAEVEALFTENVYTVPVIEFAFSLLYHKRHRNYPSDAPVLLYDWYHENIPVELRWTPVELQLSTEAYLKYIATPSTYRSQAWYKVFEGN